MGCKSSKDIKKIRERSSVLQRNYDSQVPTAQQQLDWISRIADFNSPEQITEALASAGLEYSKLIVGVDFTKSNESTGAKSFGHKCLHHIGGESNFYEESMNIAIGRLSAFNDDNLIYCYGFGDASSGDRTVFSFNPGGRPCNGIEEVLSRYTEIAPLVKLAGPTSFAPIIEMAMTIVERNGGGYHVLLIFSDGPVTRSVNTPRGELSPHEHKTIQAIVKASKFPLSIILVGVGDGPWDMIGEFVKQLPARDVPNFHFVNFTEIMATGNTPLPKKEMGFAFEALRELPAQYLEIEELHMLRGGWELPDMMIPLPPPSFGAACSSSNSIPRPNAPPYPSHTYDDYNEQVCSICISKRTTVIFGCGHMTCNECGGKVSTCPFCRAPIETRMDLY